MQEELEQKSVAISIKAGKLTANLLKKAVEKALAEMEKSQKNPKIYKGKQSVKHLVRQGAGVSNIEITDGNMATPQKFPRHINPVLMFGGNGIIEEVRQIEDGTDRGKTGQIDLAAVDRSLVGVGKFLTAPCGRNICKWLLHGVAPFSGFMPGGKQTTPCQE